MGFLWIKTKKEREKENQELAETIAEAIAEAVRNILPKEERTPIRTPEYDSYMKKPYKKLIMSNSTLTVTFHDGSILTNTEATAEMLEAIRTANSEQEIYQLLLPLELTKEDKKQIEEVEETKKLVSELSSLVNHPDFEERDGALFLKGVDLSIPKVMLKAFAEVLDEEENYNALKNFWYWLSQNPNIESREDAYRFIEHNDVKITPNGLLVLYRCIEKRRGDQTDKTLSQYISTAYFKVKQAKKGPANYSIIKDAEGEYKTMKANPATGEEGEYIGNLKDLYDGLKDMEENIYTDNRTKSMTIKIGDVYRIAEEEVDRDNRIECSSGLHVGSKSFGISGFGDTKVLVLVNPSKIRAVPQYDSNKMRVSEMFVASKLEQNSNGDYMDAEHNLVELDDLYFNIGVEELRKLAENANIQELERKNLLPAIPISSMKYIADQLEKGRKVIENRVKKLN